MPAPRAAGEMKKGGCGGTPPAFPLLFKGFHVHPKGNWPMVRWLGQMVSLCAMVLFKSEKQGEVKLEGGIRERKVLESK